MKYLILLVLFLTSFNVYGIIEFSTNWGYHKQIYGNNRQNTLSKKVFSTGIAMYFFNWTALEITYSRTKDRFLETVSTSTVDIAPYTITGSNTTVNTDIYGLGIRQRFSSTRDRVRPSISFGIASQKTISRTDYILENTITSQRINLNSTPRETEVSAAFITFAFDIGVSQRIALRASVKTVFKAFEFNRASDNLRYTAGFTWYF